MVTTRAKPQTAKLSSLRPRANNEDSWSRTAAQFQGSNHTRVDLATKRKVGLVTRKQHDRHGKGIGNASATSEESNVRKPRGIGEENGNSALKSRITTRSTKGKGNAVLPETKREKASSSIGIKGEPQRGDKDEQKTRKSDKKRGRKAKEEEPRVTRRQSLRPSSLPTPKKEEGRRDTATGQTSKHKSSGSLTSKARRQPSISSRVTVTPVRSRRRGKRPRRESRPPLRFVEEFEDKKEEMPILKRGRKPHSKAKQSAEKSQSTVWDKFRSRIRAQLSRVRYLRSFIDAYTSSWRRDTTELIIPHGEISRAEERILTAKRTMKKEIAALLKVNEQDKRLECMMYPDDDGVDVEKLECSRCHSSAEAEDNDFLMCDYESCFRAYHQQCLDPPVKSDDILDDDSDWFCHQCDCLIDCLALINEEFGTHYSANNLFPELDGVSTKSPRGQTSPRGRRRSFHEDSSSDEDFSGTEESEDSMSDGSLDLEVEDSFAHLSGAEMSNDEDSGEGEKTGHRIVRLRRRTLALNNVQSEEAEFPRSPRTRANPTGSPRVITWQSNTFKRTNTEKTKANKGSTASGPISVGKENSDDEDEEEGESKESLIVTGKRKRNHVDYRLLNDLLFGDQEDPDAYTDSEDDGHSGDEEARQREEKKGSKKKEMKREDEAKSATKKRGKQLMLKQDATSKRATNVIVKKETAKRNITETNSLTGTEPTPGSSSKSKVNNKTNSAEPKSVQTFKSKNAPKGGRQAKDGAQGETKRRKLSQAKKLRDPISLPPPPQSKRKGVGLPLSGSTSPNPRSTISPRTTTAAATSPTGITNGAELPPPISKPKRGKRSASTSSTTPKTTLEVVAKRQKVEAAALNTKVSTESMDPAQSASHKISSIVGKNAKVVQGQRVSSKNLRTGQSSKSQKEASAKSKAKAAVNPATYKRRRTERLESAGKECRESDSEDDILVKDLLALPSTGEAVSRRVRGKSAASLGKRRPTFRTEKAKTLARSIGNKALSKATILAQAKKPSTAEEAIHLSKRRATQQMVKPGSTRSKRETGTTRETLHTTTQRRLEAKSSELSELNNEKTQIRKSLRSSVPQFDGGPHIQLQHHQRSQPLPQYMTSSIAVSQPNFVYSSFFYVQTPPPAAEMARAHIPRKYAVV